MMITVPCGYEGCRNTTTDPSGFCYQHVNWKGRGITREMRKELRHQRPLSVVPPAPVPDPTPPLTNADQKRATDGLFGNQSIEQVAEYVLIDTLDDHLEEESMMNGESDINRAAYVSAVIGEVRTELDRRRNGSNSAHPGEE